MNTVYLSRRNLLTLLAKLDRTAKGEEPNDGLHTLIKRDTRHIEYPCSSITSVTAVEDEDYYIDREPGPSRDAP